jgi:subtilase family serine protease
MTAAAVLMAPAVATATSGLDPIRVKGSTPTGALKAAHVPVTLVLAARPGLKQAAAKGGGLTPAQFNARYAPSKARVKAVRAWAKRRGLKVASVSANRTLVRLTGSAAKVGKAFGTRLKTFKAPNGAAFFAPAHAAKVPARLQAISVLGLSNLGRTVVNPPWMKSGKPTAAPLPGVPALPKLPVPVPTIVPPLPHVRIPTAHASQATDFPRSYGPQELAALYNAPAGQTGAGQSLAVIAQGDVSGPQADPATFETQNGLPHVNWHQVNVGTPSDDASGDGEWDLDTQYSTGMAPGVSDLYVYVGSTLSNDDILATINRWVTDDTTRQASFSAGECELLAAVTGFTDSLDQVLAQAAAQGQTLFVSSGDTGVFCTAIVGANGVPAGIPSVAYPASSPYAIGIGGTTVLGPGPTEVSWYAGGGGASAFESAPAWQGSAGGSFLGVSRGVPDVSLDADPNSGY